MRISPATVTSPTHRYTKAKVELDDGLLVVLNTRRQELLRVEAERVDDGPGRWRYGDVTVERASGCTCGGTKVQLLGK